MRHPEPIKQPKTVLCLDDERGALAVRSMLLESAGYKVLVATSAEGALGVFNKNHVDLVLSDQVLKGTSGAEVAAQMKKLRPRVPIVLYSGIMAAEVPAHIDAFISKDTSPTDLLVRLADLLQL